MGTKFEDWAAAREELHKDWYAAFWHRVFQELTEERLTLHPSERKVMVTDRGGHDEQPTDL